MNNLYFKYKFKENNSMMIIYKQQLYIWAALFSKKSCRYAIQFYWLVIFNLILIIKMSATKTPSKRIWKPADTEKLYDCFRTKEIDPKDQTPQYIKRVYNINSLIQDIHKKVHSFYRTYRLLLRTMTSAWHHK